MRKRAILCVAVVLLTGAWWSTIHAQQSTTFSEADLQFMAVVATGGAGEVELGRLAAARAANDAVRGFGQRMVSDHGAASAQLLELARQKGVILPPGPGPRFRATYDRLASLPGGEFDRAYILEMVNDHDRDVREFEGASQMARDQDLRAWAMAMLPVLREHQRLARQLTGLLAQPTPAALPAAVVVVPPAPEPLWCGGAWSLKAGSNFTVCPR